MQDKMLVLSVGILNDYVKMMLEGNDVLSDVYIRGEISNFTNHYKTGHYYFTLKDETGALRAVMFRSYASRLPFVPENGMKVLVHGRVTVYVRDGQYQLNADGMQPDGIGALYVAFEQLKAKLAAEGLFDEARKRPLPRMPMRIGIITSPTGAAIHDMTNILGRRFPLCEPILYPSLVQGAGAPAQLIRGLAYFNDINPVDVIIIGRGGGSMEDLFAFNDEGLARAVAASRIPTISAVGHESDFTICDFVADRRAPTPSAAAELAVPEKGELRRGLENVLTRMRQSMTASIGSARERVNALGTSRALSTPYRFVEDMRMTVGQTALALDRGMALCTERARGSFLQLGAKLEALSPLAILSRGYAVARKEGKPLVSVASVEAGDELRLTLADGEVYARAEKVVSHVQEESTGGKPAQTSRNAQNKTES